MLTHGWNSEMKFTEIPAPYFELRPEIGTAKSRKRNEMNRAPVRVAKCKVAVQLRLMRTTIVGTSIAKELTLPQTSG
jgi:hypothetical protein